MQQVDSTFEWKWAHIARAVCAAELQHLVCTHRYTASFLALPAAAASMSSPEERMPARSWTASSRGLRTTAQAAALLLPLLPPLPASAGGFPATCACGFPGRAVVFAAASIALCASGPRPSELQEVCSRHGLLGFRKSCVAPIRHPDHPCWCCEHAAAATGSAFPCRPTHLHGSACQLMTGNAGGAPCKRVGAAPAATAVRSLSCNLSACALYSRARLMSAISSSSQSSAATPAIRVKHQGQT